MLNKKINMYVMDMDKMSEIEKAKIFYNHLYFNKVPNEYCTSIRENKNYLKIINHRNYNPRIIAYVTQLVRYKDIEAKLYFDFILSKLNNPEDVWKSEYNDRIQPVDRIFMLTLFSFTDTTVNEKVIEECFNRRLMNSGLDTTSYPFKNALIRLNKSMVKVIDNKDNKEIAVLNPSINDYLNKVFYDNEAELFKIRESIMFYDQIGRCYPKEEISNVINEKIKNNEFITLKMHRTDRYKHIETVLLYYISEHNILNTQYKSNVKQYIENLSNEILSNTDPIRIEKIMIKFLDEPLYSFYDMNKCITDKDFIEIIYSYLRLEDLPDTINVIYQKLERVENIEFLEEVINISIKHIIQEIEHYIEQIDVDDFTDDLDLDDYLNGNSIIEISESEDSLEDYKRVIDKAVSHLYEEFKEEIQEVFDEIINELEVEPIKDDILRYVNSINLDEYDWEQDIISYVENCLEPDYDDYGSHEEDDILEGNTSTSTNYEFDEIDNMFERDF